MFVNKQVNRLESRYGMPDKDWSEWEMTKKEFNLVKASMLSGRRHDVTLLIFQRPFLNLREISIDSPIAVIRKPYYQPGVYRPPSGGISPSENFEFGVKREAKEETGLMVNIHRYLLRSNVRFTYCYQTVDWQTHVFVASTLDQVLYPTDIKEIADARWVTWGKLGTGLLKKLKKASSIGLRYRGYLQEKIIEYCTK